MSNQKIALVGNPNSGKTTLFNAFTGSNQHVGNWPGVTVEKKEGILKYKNKEYDIIDLPGIYSLGAFSEDEIVAMDYVYVLCGSTTTLRCGCFSLYAVYQCECG